MTIINGTPGNDALVGTSDSDTFNGLSGFDTAQVAAGSAEAVFSLDAQGRWVVTSSQGTDTLGGMEAVRFLRDTVTLGGEFRVNTFTPGNQAEPVIAPLAGGGFVVAWVSDGQDGSDSGIYSQRFDANGTPVGAETRVNTSTAGSQASPSVTALANGGYVVVWRSSVQSDANSDIYSQRFDAHGAAVGGETRVNTTLESRHNEPSVTALSDGGYVVAWWFVVVEGQNTFPAIHTQRFDPNGEPVGSQLRVDNTNPVQFQPAVAGLQDGGHVVTWAALSGASGQDIFSQRFDAAGAPVGSATLVNTVTYLGQVDPAIAALKDGGYVVAWMSYGQDGSEGGVYAQRFDSSGARVGQETPVNINWAGDQSLPAIAALPDGGYLISWMSDSQDDSGYDIHARRFDAQGRAVSGELQVNTTTAANQMSAAVTALDDGGYLVAWMSYGQDGSGGGVYAQRFDASDTPLSSGASLRGDGQANTLHFSGSRAVELIGLDGDDTLQGGSNDDVLNGGPGQDTAVVSDRHSLLTWQLSADGALYLHSPSGGSDQLVSVEQVQAEGARIGVQGAEGRELRVNTTTQGNQGGPAVTPLKDGAYLVIWNSDDGSQQGMYAQRFDSSGTPTGSETRVVNAQLGGVGAALNSGGYVVVWSSYLQDGSGYGVYAQRFDDSGRPLGGETQVNSVAAGDQLGPVVTALDGGGYVVAWTSQDPGGGYGVQAQRFDDTGARVGDETRVSTSDLAGELDITALADGGYVVTWMFVEDKAIGEVVYAIGQVYFQRFDAAGLALGSETRVVSAIDSNEYNPAITALEDGGFVIAWASYERTRDDWDILVRRFDAIGAAVGDETRVNTTTAGSQENAHIVTLGDGGYVVTWSSDDGSGLGVYAQRFDAAGGRVGGELRVNTTTQGFQYPGGVAALDDGGYVVAWTSEERPNNADVFTQRFDANNLREGHLTLTGGAEDNVLRMASAAEGVELVGAGGADTLAGAGSWDVLRGGSGADTFEFAASGNGVDIITDWGSGDRISIAGASFTGAVTAGTGQAVALNAVEASTSAGVTTLYIGTDAAPGADVLIRLTGSFAAESFALQANRIEAPTGQVITGRGPLVGGPGDDTLIAQRGVTRMEGGAGNDTYVLGNPNDRLIEQAGGGIDEVQSRWSHTLGDHLERLVLTGERPIRGTGNDLDNVITGNSAHNVLTGGAGADTLVGGAGADCFVYRSVRESSAAPGAWDRVLDFSSLEGDRIDLRDIDANPARPGKQGFVFIGTADFSSNDATGQMRFDGGTHLLYASVDADAQAEMVIELAGVSAMSSQDFLL